MKTEIPVEEFLPRKGGLAPTPTFAFLAAMLVHSVYFWLKPELTPAERAQFVAGLESLRAIPSVESLHIGTPAPVTDRPVVDRSYSYNALVLFQDVAGHDAYQVHPVHQAFVAQNKALWTSVKIYDAA